jgi:hypothetical protein
MRWLLAMLAALGSWPAAAQTSAPLPDGPLFMAYYESWTELPVPIASATRLANLPGYIDVVAISFVRPDLTYDGRSLQGTGLQVPFDSAVLAQAIAKAKTRNPRLKVLLAVGGSSYSAGWSAFAAAPLAQLVNTLGADGVDLDFEPADPQCRPQMIGGASSVVCATDGKWAEFITKTRAVLPRPALLTLPAWSVGAYGQKGFEHEQPSGRYTGSMLWLQRLPEARELDLIAIMAYDAGPSFDPGRALAAYQAIAPTRVLLGVEVPPDANGGATYSVERMKKYAAQQAGQKQGGIMLYSLTRGAPGGDSSVLPDAAMCAYALCSALGRTGCEEPLP